MKNQLSIFIVFFLFFSCASAKQSDPNAKYFDANDRQITYSEFKRAMSSKHFLEIPGELPNSKKLITREQRGLIKDKHLIDELLEVTSGRKVAPNKNTVIIYYPGKDDCNKTISLSKPTIETMESELMATFQITPFYIFKNDKRLKRYANFLDWHKDPEEFFEKTFFKHHYPCTSFVIISPNGNYISYFGEFSTQKLYDGLVALNKM